MDKKKNNSLEIITGTGEELNISPVETHIKINQTEKKSTTKKIIIPKGKEKKNTETETNNNK